MFVWIVSSLLSIAHAEAPEGWLLAGSAPNDYEVELVSEARSGAASAKYFSKGKAKEDGFGTLMQNMQAVDYEGHRVRMSAWVKAEEVSNWAGLWLRVDGGKARSLSFDNMEDRPITGTQDWTKHEIVLDVPNGATNIAFGILVAGEGTVWLDDLSFEIVPETVEQTGVMAKVPYEVVNGSFED